MHKFRHILDFSAGLIISSILFISCQAQPVIQSHSENLTDNTSRVQQPVLPTENITLKSGFEIPSGSMPQREKTYDDIMYTPGAGLTYRGNILEYKQPPKWEHVEGKEVSLKNGFKLSYRNNIETKAGQVRTLIFVTGLPGSEMSRNYEVIFEQANIQEAIQVKKIDQSTWYLDRQAFMIDISPKVKPGDYKLGFFIYINEEYYENLPCTIHVIE